MATLPTDVNDSPNYTPAQHATHHNTLHGLNNQLGNFTQSTSAPGSPSDGDLWLDTDEVAPSFIPVWTKLSRTVLVSNSASIDITSIPSTYDHLRLTIKARSTEAAVPAVNLLIRFNNDSAGNYDWQRVQGANSSLDATQAFAQTSGVIGVIPAATALANLFSIATVEIPEYAATDWQKLISSTSVHKENTSGGAQRAAVYSTAWRSTAAINQITILTSSNLLAGSAVTLYGIGGTV
jgi:hypothetical protein